MIKLIALFMVLLGAPGRDSVKSETGEVPACLREYFTAARDSAWEPNAGDVFFAVTPGPREGGLYREAWSDSTQLLTPLIHYNMKCKGRYLIFSHENVDMKRQHRFYSGKKKPAQSPLLVVR